MSAASFSKSRRRRISCLLLLVVVLVVGCLVFPLFLPLFRSPKVDAKGNISNLVSYLFLYQEQFGRFPLPIEKISDDSPPASWRVAIVSAGYDEQHKGYDFEKSWDDPANASFGETFAHLFCHAPDKPTETSYMMVTGPGTVFHEKPEMSLEELPPQLILIVRVNESGVHWMQPTDLSISADNEALSAQIRIPDVGIVVMFGDLKVWVLDEDTPVEKLRPFFFFSEDQKLNREETLGPHRW